MAWEVPPDRQKDQSMTTNEITLARAFRDAGIAQEQAEHIAETIFGAIRENVATKADLRQEIAAVNARIDLVEHRLMTRLGALMVVVSGLLFAALHQWPPHF